MSDSSNSTSEQIVKLIGEPLNLPDGSCFVSDAPTVPILQMIALSEKFLPILNSHPDFIEKRKKLAIKEAFFL
jgi:hypothetical protein